MTNPSLSDWGLYIHIPFCRSRCTYCDFNTVTGMGEEDHRRYVDALLLQWQRISAIPRGNLVSIFIGGGTPSLLAPDHIDRILEAVRRKLGISLEGVEITMEANPGTVNESRLHKYRLSGVNRLSLGVQAWQNHHLQRLKRAHSVLEAAQGVEAARLAGFDNINLDLIYGLPQQTLAEWEDSLTGVLGLNPDHLSLYQLQVEEGTPLAVQLQRGRASLPAGDMSADMADRGRERLIEAGFVPYEISNYCRPNKHSRHNRLYWTMNPYLALGAGAHGYWNARRWWIIRGVRRYIEDLQAGGNGIAGEERLERLEEMREYIWLGLREEGGFSRNRFRDKFSINPESAFGAVLGGLHRRGLVERQSEYIRLTGRGRDLANYVFREFVGSS